MESAESIWRSLHRDVWVNSIDLVDIYFHIPIHRGYRQCLRFQIRDSIYQFRALPFGLSPAPWVFTTIMTDIKMLVHVMGINLCQYLDDWLIYSPSHDQCLRDTVQVLNLCHKMGLLIHDKKSELIPKQKFLFLEYQFDLVSFQVTPTLDRYHKIKALICSFMLRQRGCAHTWQKIQQELQNPQVGNSHQFTSVFRSREALHSPSEFSSTGFLFSRDSPVVDKSFTEISRSHVGRARLGTEQKYFRDLAAMTRRRLCISSFQGWTGATLNRSIQGLIDHLDIGSVSTEQLLEHLKATLQLSQSVATAWYDGATLDSAIAYNILLHQRDQVLPGVSPLVPLEDRERLRTAPFGASLLFDELATKLQLRDKVASRQRDYALYWGSAPLTVGKTRAAPHQSAPARSAQLWQASMPMSLSFSRQQPFLATRGRGSGLPFHQRGGRRHRSGLPVSQTRALVSPIVTRPSTLDPLDIPRQVVVLPPLLWDLCPCSAMSGDEGDAASEFAMFWKSVSVFGSESVPP